MMPQTSIASSLNAINLIDFDELQQRYQALSLTQRAHAVLQDADLALRTADRIVSQLSSNINIGVVFDSLRTNAILMAKVRPSEAKNMFLDQSVDFLDVARHKLAVWRKTMERISQGEAILYDHLHKEYISGNMPLAMAIHSASSVSTYLSMIQLVMGELAKLDHKQAQKIQMDAAKIRRCATFLSDCEHAACFREMVH